MPRSPAFGYTLVSMAATLWATVGILGRYTYGLGVTPLTLAASRPIIAGAAILLGLLAFRPKLLRVERRDLPFFALYGLVSVAIFFYSLFYAFQKTSVATAWVLLYTAPAYVMVLSAILYRERLTRLKWLSLVLTIAGSVLVSGAYSPSALRLNASGVIAGLTSGLTYGLYSIFGRKALERYNPWTAMLYSFTFGGLFLLIAWAPGAAGQLPAVGRSWPILLLAALGPTLLSYTFYMNGLTMIETSKASIAANLEPVMATVLAYIFLAERISPLQLAGGILVIGGVLAIQLADVWRARRAGPAADPHDAAGPSEAGGGSVGSGSVA